jgi:hypothetical protein
MALYGLRIEGRMNTRMQSTGATTDVDDGLILALWKQGIDTLDIARRLGVHESEVANRLFHIREAARRG